MGEISDRFCDAESAKNPHAGAVWDKLHQLERLTVLMMPDGPLSAWCVSA